MNHAPQRQRVARSRHVQIETAHRALPINQHGGYQRDGGLSDQLHTRGYTSRGSFEFHQVVDRAEHR